MSHFQSISNHDLEYFLPISESIIPGNFFQLLGEDSSNGLKIGFIVSPRAKSQWDLVSIYKGEKNSRINLSLLQRTFPALLILLNNRLSLNIQQVSLILHLY